MRKQGPIWALGAMSGTSLDGVDAAMVQTDGVEIFAFGPKAFRPYTPAEQSMIRAALGQWPDGPDVAAAAEVVETAHVELLSRFKGAEVVGFHGQTLAHDPAAHGTHQCGDGSVITAALDLPTVWDFRSSDVTMGGQGAPLAPFFHFACARRIGATEPLAFLNLGGVGNITWVNPAATGPEAKDALLAFDTGPANAPINDLMRARLCQSHDKDGTLAATGNPDPGILSIFLAHPYFLQPPPKSLDRNAFHQLLDDVADLSDADAAATLTAAAAAAVAVGVRYFPKPVTRMLVCGGGRHNATLMSELALRLDCTVEPVEAAGLDGDMLEAQAFAYLAVRVARRMATSAPGTTGAPTLVGGGQLSRPGQVQPD
jgi:anhydro-N-acetylmuramic acid kinase